MPSQICVCKEKGDRKGGKVMWLIPAWISQVEAFVGGLTYHGQSHASEISRRRRRRRIYFLPNTMSLNRAYVSKGSPQSRKETKKTPTWEGVKGIGPLKGERGSIFTQNLDGNPTPNRLRYLGKTGGDDQRKLISSESKSVIDRIPYWGMNR